MECGIHKMACKRPDDKIPQEYQTSCHTYTHTGQSQATFREMEGQWEKAREGRGREKGGRLVAASQRNVISPVPPVYVKA